MLLHSKHTATLLFITRHVAALIVVHMSNHIGISKGSHCFYLSTVIVTCTQWQGMQNSFEPPRPCFWRGQTSKFTYFIRNITELENTGWYLARPSNWSIFTITMQANAAISQRKICLCFDQYASRSSETDRLFRWATGMLSHLQNCWMLLHSID